jgi:hypothetical protein
MSGLVGEHIASAAIVQRGWGCGMVMQDDYDLIATKGRESYRVQVRSCQLSKRIKYSKRTMQFPVGKGKDKRFPSVDDYDILALVSSEQRGCFFMPISAIDRIKFTKPTSLFTPEREIDSWDQTIRILRDECTKQTALRDNRTRHGSSRNR